jgi:hypothetical protein
VPPFQAATANLNRAEAKVDTKNPNQGPLLIIGEKENTLLLAIAYASSGAAQQRGYRDRRDPKPWPCAHGRQRLMGNH